MLVQLTLLFHFVRNSVTPHAAGRRCHKGFVFHMSGRGARGWSRGTSTAPPALVVGRSCRQRRSRVLLLWAGVGTASLSQSEWRAERARRSGGRRGATAPRSARGPLDTLAMKFSAESLSTGGGTQVRHHHHAQLLYYTGMGFLLSCGYLFRQKELSFSKLLRLAKLY